MTLLMIGSKLIGLQLKGFHFCTFLCDVGWFPSRWKNTTGKWQCEKGRERKCKSSRACFKDMWADAIWSSCRGKVTRNFKQGLLETFTTSQVEKTQNPGVVLFLRMTAWLPGSYHFLECGCAADTVPLSTSTLVLIFLTSEGWQAESTPKVFNSATIGART